jgi:hypothetical protein
MVAAAMLCGIALSSLQQYMSVLCAPCPNYRHMLRIQRLIVIPSIMDHYNDEQRKVRPFLDTQMTRFLNFSLRIHPRAANRFMRDDVFFSAALGFIEGRSWREAGPSRRWEMGFPR